MRVIALDFETTTKPLLHPWIDGAYAVMLSIVDNTGFRKSWVFNHDELYNHGDDPCKQADDIKEIQEEINRSDRMVGQHLKFDLNWLKHLNIDFSNIKLYCTKIADYIINGHARIGYSLNDICKRRGIQLKHDDVRMYWEQGYETSQIPLNILVPYCENDCDITLQVYYDQISDIKRLDLIRPVSLACNLMGLLSEIECTGMKADKDLGMILVSDIQQQLDLIDLGLKEKLGDINLSSGDELSAALFGGILKRPGREQVHRKLKSGKIKTYTRKCVNEVPIDGAGFTPAKGTETKKKGYYQTNKGVIEQLGARTKVQKDIKKGLISRSAIAQSLESLWGENGTGIINKIQSDGCIHPQYNQTVTVTGRLSSQDPNGQNLPREGTSPIKRIFIPRFDQIVSADLAQLEWRVCALLSQDPIMIQEIWDGSDVHGDNAINFFGDIEYRKTAKFFTFRMIYGGSAYGFYMDYKMPNFSLKKWEGIVDAFYNKYAGLRDWQIKNVRHVIKHGTLTIPSGRFFKFNKIKGEYSPRQIKNYPVQGFSFDIVKLAMLIIKKKVQHLKSLMIGQVHDEVVFDNYRPEFKDLGRTCIMVFENLPNYMKSYWGFDSNVPFTGDIERGPNYEAMKELLREYFFS